MKDYKQSILTYIDVLGFREIVNSKSCQEIRELLNTLREHTKPGDFECDELEMNYFNFSDLIIRTTNILSDANIQYPTGLIYNEFVNVIYALIEFITKGSFVRGAITIGDACSENGLLFGPALIRAYELESEVAIYPRVIIDPIVFKELENSKLLINIIHDLECEKCYLNKLVRKDIDGIYYIDYLRAAEWKLDDLETYPDFLKVHKNLIEELAKRINKLDKISSKASWLAHYYNSTVSDLKDEFFQQFGCRKKDYLIEMNEFPIFCDINSVVE